MIEVIAALAIVSIALLGLLQLHLVSLKAADRTQTLTQAVLLAQEKMAETLAGGYPPVGTRWGVAEADGASFTWRTEVAAARPSQPHQPALPLTGLRRLSVDVAWETGAGGPHVQMTTYVADGRIHE
jgi:type II secretion system protein I